jgi:hypothetical protein
VKKLLTALPTITLFLFSCQKELSFDSTVSPGNGGPTGELLVKTVAVTGSETLTTLYSYDIQKQLESTTLDGKSGGMTIHNYKKLERDAAGRVIRILQKDDSNGISSDTSVNDIHYPNATTLEYDYSVTTMGLMGFSTTDSTEYSFSNGKMLNFTSFLSSPLLGSTSILASKYEFTYDGSGRVATLKMYSMGTVPGGPLTHIADQIYTYASSVNSTWPPTNAAQAYLIFGMPNATNDAIATLKFESMEPSVPSSNTTVTYVLGAGNKPTAATYTSTDGQVTKYTFYYQ